MTHKLTELHEKAVKVLSVIEDADRMLKGHEKNVEFNAAFSFKKDWDYWKARRISTRAARTKLIRYHQSILNQINELTTKL